MIEEINADFENISADCIKDLISENENVLVTFEDDQNVGALACCSYLVKHEHMSIEDAVTTLEDVGLEELAKDDIIQQFKKLVDYTKSKEKAALIPLTSEILVSQGNNTNKLLNSGENIAVID